MLDVDCDRWMLWGFVACVQAVPALQARLAGAVSDPRYDCGHCGCRAAVCPVITCRSSQLQSPFGFATLGGRDPTRRLGCFRVSWGRNGQLVYAGKLAEGSTSRAVVVDAVRVHAQWTTVADKTLVTAVGDCLSHAAAAASAPGALCVACMYVCGSMVVWWW